MVSLMFCIASWQLPPPSLESSTSNRLTMDVLTGATGINIERSQFSNVGKNQYNDCTIHQTIIEKRAKIINRDLPGLSEFTEVKWGDIYKDKDVCYSWRLCSNAKLDNTEAAVFHAEINIVGSFGQKKYTVKTYHGRNGKKEWRRDLLRCSGDWHRDIPLFGYTRSSVPSLIFYGDLVPIAHIEVQLGWVGHMYLEMLKNALGCSRNEIWMDPTKGTFCRGPVGPKCLEWNDNFGSITIPSDVDFLREDVIFRYFFSMRYDQGLVWALSYSRCFEGRKELPSYYYPHVISGLTNSTIAFERNVYWWSLKGCLHSKGGTTRFLLTDHGRYLEAESGNETHSWLSQALSVFHVHNIQFDEDFSNFKFVFSHYMVKGTLQKSKHKRQRRQLEGPIYLFLSTSPSPYTRCYFWSHDPSGQDQLSPDMCRYLGLPITLCITAEYSQLFWPTKVYKALHDYQVSRGFDPTTTDFAQFHGLNIFEIVAPENQFQEVDVEEAKNTPHSSQNDEDDGGVGSTSTQLVQKATGGSLMNTLSSWFTLDAVESSGISAAAF
ncbi:hypothetical protein L218DRAFT_988702 [Marasmius fiardii PR-910]|nr:hypothetical protein L218DRAFT_988702 [Marasmius fiardii PR-910]